MKYTTMMKLLIMGKLPGLGIVICFIEDLQIRQIVLGYEGGLDSLLQFFRSKSLFNLDNQTILNEGSLDDDALLHD
ncbi:MAG: hypothetical protein ABW134_15390 [Candidatus Thiodiazotropha endolucinida]